MDHHLPSMASEAVDVENVQKEKHDLPIDGDKVDIGSCREDAFGNEEHAQVKYKTLKWWQCGLLMVAETVSLGVLALPSAIAALGLGPALGILIGLGGLATYTGYVTGQFKWRYPHVSSTADAGEVLMGRFGRELLFGSNILYLVFLMASHILTFTVAMNTITKHATCSIVFGVVGLVLSFLFALPRTLKGMTWLSAISFTSIMAALFLTIIAVGVQNDEKPVKAAVKTDLVTGFTAASNIVFTFATHNTFFTMMSELKEPREFPKSLAMLQGLDLSIYLVASVVIYRYAGEDVTSPALGSAGPLISRIAYGIALPTIVIAGVIISHIACKQIYIRLHAGTARIHTKDFVSVGSWVGIVGCLWIIAWIIAMSIPVFNSLLSLIVSLFASWFSFALPGIFWFWMNKGRWFASPRKILLSCINVLAIVVGLTLCGLGLYTSGKTIHDDPSSASFSCADNS
ncbi:uncharacterized protein LDX57_008608 [Aspergillus melleus]|uniref:uncharacterized protein n=1 Tax=Aspergillus melleus TaxID=138277 RepID=UPI001E8E0A9D|nr:uncharacterized protein LDX57_008608 [Aspergillus melleus]KAH8430945.1 hypothetical protein LDX57_008608 [Aspergillus melleus]